MVPSASAPSSFATTRTKTAIGHKRAGVGATSTASKPRLSDFWPAALLLGIGMLALGIANAIPSGTKGQYLVIAPPWLSLSETLSRVQAADGRVLTIDAQNRHIVAYSEHEKFAWQLFRSGAFLVLDPAGLRGCDVPALSPRGDVI